MELQMFESFVKEKYSLLRYVHSLIRFAAKIHEIDTTEYLEETKEEEKITSEKDAQLMQWRIGLILDKYHEVSSVLDTVLE